MSTARHQVIFYMPGTGLEGPNEIENAMGLLLNDEDLQDLRDSVAWGNRFWTYRSLRINLDLCPLIDGIPES